MIPPSTDPVMTTLTGGVVPFDETIVWSSQVTEEQPIAAVEPVDHICATCRWWTVLEFFGTPLKRGMRGSCHAFPPDDDRNWPMVLGTDYCRVWEERP